MIFIVDRTTVYWSRRKRSFSPAVLDLLAMSATVGPVADRDLEYGVVAFAVSACARLIRLFALNLGQRDSDATRRRCAGELR